MATAVKLQANGAPTDGFVSMLTTGSSPAGLSNVFKLLTSMPSSSSLSRRTFPYPNAAAG